MLPKQSELTQKIVRSLFDYIAGQLVTKISTGYASKIGSPAGSDMHGYLAVKIMQRTYLVHRIIWLWHYGYLPENPIDHVDRNKRNNRIENLREVSTSCNLQNSKQRRSTSGIKGISWSVKTSRWCVFIHIDGKNRNLGTYKCLLDAACARLAAEQCMSWGSCEESSPAAKCVKTYLSRGDRS